jgi:hypothetical protein
MVTKCFAAALPAMVFIAMSGQAYAGATISDKRYWPDEVGPSSQYVVRPSGQYAVRPSDSDFGWAIPTLSGSPQVSPDAIGPEAHHYEGGPKSDD